MRTLEFSDELLAKAEAEAKRRGMSLEAWAERAFAEALEPRRAKFPIFESKNPGSLDLTPEMIRQVEHEDDMRRSGLLD